jgi:hypothetical protein
MHKLIGAGILLMALVCVNPLHATIVNETGTLRGFVIGQCMDCAYENWSSHVSEGIARAGYNDYGPSWFDPQTNGFGTFTMIPTGAGGDTTLARWRAVFRSALRGNWNAVDTLLMNNHTAWRYEIVRFTDTELQKTFYILREQLDYSYRDTNVDTIETDDIVGGFRSGWGLFVFNPTALMQKIVVQMPHPEDDFLSIPVGLDMFIEMDMLQMMIAGAGREVSWESWNPPYNNEKSLSDPSRNSRTPFAVCHEVLVDSLDPNRTSRFLALQIHSYDTGTHGVLSDLQVSAFRDDITPNPPLRDFAERKDLIHFLGRYPLTSLAGDPSINRRVDEYVSLWCWPPYSYFLDPDSVTIPSIADLTGAPSNQEGIYSHRFHNATLDPENFIHVEMDEYPDGLWQPAQWRQWLAGPLPPRDSTFLLAREYYHPFVNAMDSAIHYSHIYPDTLPPQQVELEQVVHIDGGEVFLEWSPLAADRFFETYLILYDTTEITWSSPSFSRSSANLSFLQDYRTSQVSLKGLIRPVERCQFAVAGRDIWSNRSRSASSGFTGSPIRNLTIRMVSPDSLELRWARQVSDSLYLIYRSGTDGAVWSLFQQTDSNVARVLVLEGESGFFRIWKVLNQ